jgi:hypothetical protein
MQTDVNRPGARRARPGQSLLRAVLPLVLISLACAFLSDRGTPDAATPTTTSEDVLTFLAPLYTVSLNPGESIAGTSMTYAGKDGDTYNVTLDGLAAAKRVGDSFAWKGIIAPGVHGEYDLRISPTFSGERLLAGGPVRITVLNPSPVELPGSAAVPEGWLHFERITVERSVARGEQILGTTLVYEGQSEQGAQLSGTEGYPYRARGDSLIWTGRLRGNAIVRLNLRVSAFSSDRLSLLGTAELWVDAQQ